MTTTYQAWIEHLPLPTPQQYLNFAEGLCWFHSWYKHLPLYEGAKFVFFLHPTVAEGYDEAHPRLHYAWQTTAEYRRKYGYLDYHIYEKDQTEAVWLGEPETTVPLPTELSQAAACTVFPYCSTDANALESITYEHHQEDLARIRHEPHYQPNRELILDWKKFYDWQTETWNLLSEAETQLAFDIEDEPEKYRTFSGSAALENHLQASRNLSLTYDLLQAGELAKIKLALHNLALWLERTH